MAERTALSVIVVISSDTVARRADVSHLEGCLQALSKQKDPPEMEIIVPHHEDVDGIEELSRRYPAVVFLPVPIVSIADREGGGREHHDVLRAHGIHIAQGELIAMASATPYAAVAPMSGAPRTIIVLIASAASLIVRRCLVTSSNGSCVWSMTATAPSSDQIVR